MIEAIRKMWRRVFRPRTPTKRIDPHQAEMAEERLTLLRQRVDALARLHGR